MGKGEKRITMLRMLALLTALSFYPLPFTPPPTLSFDLALREMTQPPFHCTAKAGWRSSDMPGPG